MFFMLNALLRYGYFPAELPSLFSTDSFAEAINKAKRGLPECMTNTKAGWTQPTHHNLARVGGLRRRLSVPNPVNYFRVAKSFAANSAAIETKWSESPFSHTSPKLSSGGPRAISPRNGDRATPRALARVGAKYLLRADISQFYPSIYTHTIPWALHTKEVAKRSQKDMSLAGNVLDKELQACQHGQTKGISIGPDTSLGVAELLLSPIDRRLHDECNINGGVRFIDDMEFSFQRLADAEKALARLEALLYEYELQLNGNKTKIIVLPDSLDSSFVSQLRPHIPVTTTIARSQWIDYFNRAFVLTKEFPSEGVLRYAIASLQGLQVSPKLWELVQSLLWQSISSDPGCLRFVIDFLWLNLHGDNSHVLDSSMANSALNSLVSSSAPVGHGSEVVWSIWAAMLFNLNLSDTSWGAITQMDDSFVAVAALVCNKHSNLADELSSDIWDSWLEEGCFEQNHWLFSYEAYRNGWMADKLTKANLDGVVACKFMKNTGITFVDEQKILNYRPARLQSVCGGGGGGGY